MRQPPDHHARSMIAASSSGSILPHSTSPHFLPESVPGGAAWRPARRLPRLPPASSPISSSISTACSMSPSSTQNQVVCRAAHHFLCDLARRATAMPLGDGGSAAGGACPGSHSPWPGSGWSAPITSMPANALAAVATPRSARRRHGDHQRVQAGRPAASPVPACLACGHGLVVVGVHEGQACLSASA